MFQALVLALAVICQPAPVLAQPDSGEPQGQPPAGEEQPPAGAEPTTTPPEPTPTPQAEQDLEKAKRLFKEGNALRKAGDCQRAVELYRRSRALFPSVANTRNAAVCLRDLDRIDEALEMYEALLTKFGDKLQESERKLIAQEMSEIRGRVGAIDVLANTDGTLVIDGRKRGELPLEAPVRVTPGRHRVLVMKEGYKSYETVTEVKVRQTAAISARLEPLADSGRVRIAGDGIDGAEVLVDGAPLGTVPWEGSLEPGEHRFSLRRGDEGTAPQTLIVVKGQTVSARAKLLPLGAALRIRVEPPTAVLRIGGVEVGSGQWHGRLPLGDHMLSAAEDGYHSKEQQLQVDAASDGALVKLDVDDDHPRWESLESGGPWVEVFGGLAIAPTLGSEAETSDCQEAKDCSGGAVALGFMAGARGGYEFPLGLSLELAAGYIHLSNSFERKVGLDDSVYALQDQLTYQGPFVAGGVTHRLPFADIFEMRVHLLLGAVFVDSGDAISGDLGDFDVEGAGVDLLIMPEAQLGMRFDGLGFGIGVAAPILALADPKAAENTFDASSDRGIARSVLSNDRTYGTAITLVPSASVGYLF